MGTVLVGGVLSQFGAVDIVATLVTSLGIVRELGYASKMFTAQN